MAAPADCPELEALAGFAAGAHDDALARHVGACADCTRLVAELRGQHQLEQRVARALTPGGGGGGARGALPVLAGYRILREIGRGGMGVVYAAEQENTRRKTAIKVVRGSQYVNEATLKLFQREIRALARLQHPGIAPLYEAGCTPDGEHFFAMELVEGETLLLHARSRGLTRRARLELFARICDAIHYAHQQAVIHRDLKPSNILVDARGEPRVLDFGLAKITDADASIATQLSLPGSIRGTLAYMSPEQAGGDPEAVDLRSDVYSLGVILFELLTEVLPYDVGSTRMVEAVRVICEQRPERPSTLDPALRGDLDTIVLKALEKDPARRYSSAAALGEDVRRHLADEVILARPASGLYQMRKLVARHKLPFALAGLIFVLSLGAAVWLGVLYTKAERLRVDAEESGKAARAAQALAEERLELAEDLGRRRQRVINYFQDMLGAARHEMQGPNVRVVDLLEKSDRTLADRTDLAPADAAAIGVSVAGLYNSLGDFPPTERWLRWSLDRRAAARLPVDRDDVFLHAQLADVLLRVGRAAEAEKALDTAETLADQAPAVESRLRYRMRGLRARFSTLRGDLPGAEAALRALLAEQRAEFGDDDPQTLAILTEFGNLLGTTGRLLEAEPLVRERAATALRLYGEDHPDTLNALSNLGMLLLDTERYEEGRALYEDIAARQARVIGTEHVHYLGTRTNLAGAYLRLDQPEKALEIWLELLPVQERVVGRSSALALSTLMNIGSTLLTLKRPAEAELHLNVMLERCEADLPPTHPLKTRARTYLGRAVLAQGRVDEAEELLLASYRELEAMPGANPAWFRNAASALVELYESTDRKAEAEPYRAAWRKASEPAR